MQIPVQPMVYLQVYHILNPLYHRLNLKLDVIYSTGSVFYLLINAPNGIYVNNNASAQSIAAVDKLAYVMICLDDRHFLKPKQIVYWLQEL